MEKARNFIEEIINKDLAEGRHTSVLTRFPPEPNGYLHIGHAKAVCLNFGLAKKYGGRCNIRFDDTNPLKEDEEFCRAIVEDIRWLGFDGDVLYSSDYFPVMYATAVKLIEKGKAYVCDMTADEIRASRGTLTEPGRESPYRNRTVTENLRLFTEMREGKYADGEKVLRAKIDMASPNINMRDPVIYRVLHANHHRQGDAWCVYPLYDFAHPIEDAVERITHSCCTLEFEDHRPLYDWVVVEGEFDPAPHQYEFARLNLTRTIMSKRFLKKLVDDRVVDGWDDPRMPTLAGMRRRGYPPEAIREFCELIGVAKSNSVVDAGLLEFCVRNVLNTRATRVMAVLEPLEVELTDYEGSEELPVENNPQDEVVTYRNVAFSKHIYIERADFAENPPPKYHRLTVGGIVRLKGAYVIRCDSVVKDSEGNVVKLLCSVLPGTKSGGQNSGMKVKGTIHWVDTATAVDITVNRLDYLLLPPDGEKKDFTELANPVTRITFAAKGEAALADTSCTEYQFMRTAYFSRDVKSGGMVFNEIVSLKDSYKP